MRLFNIILVLFLITHKDCKCGVTMNINLLDNWVKPKSFVQKNQCIVKS